MTGGKKGGGGKGDKGAWKGYSAKGYTYIPIGPQWKAAAGSAGVPFPGPRQWAHPLQPAGGKGLSWCQEQPAGYMLSMCREVTPTVQAVTPTATFALAQKDFPDFTSTNTFTPLQEDFPELETKPVDAGKPTTRPTLRQGTATRPTLRQGTTQTPKRVKFETAEKDARAPAEGAVADEKRDGEASAPPFATTKRDWRRHRKTSLAT